MAKVTEGYPYYYAPLSETSTVFVVHKNREHPRRESLCSTYSQEHASLIVDALNYYTKRNDAKHDAYSTMIRERDKNAKT